MNLTIYSRNEILKTLAQWDVPKDYADPMYNYLVHGYSPGSFFTAVLANDFGRAVQCSHPSNSIAALKALVGWLNEYMPREAKGSHATVGRWLAKTDADRRAVLESAHLVYTEKEEVWMALKGVQSIEPVLF